MTPSFPPAIDSTMLVCWRACPRKFFNEYCLNLAPAGKSVDLHFGGAIAHALELARRAYYIDGASFADAKLVGLNAAWSFWGDFEAPEGHAKDLAGLLLTLERYYEEYPFPSDPLRPAYSGAAIEVGFAIPLSILHPETNAPLLYAGRFDMIGEMNAVRYVVDEKTTGRSFPHNWAQSWTLRNQFMGYIYAANALGYDVSHALVRGICIQKTSTSFLQAPVAFPSHLLERFEHQLYTDLLAMIDQYKRELLDPLRGVPFNFGDTCTSYGICPFNPVCSAKVPSDWYSMYGKRSWNPIRQDPAELTSMPGAAA